MEKRGGVISILAERRRSQPTFHRAFGAKYILFRLATEDKLRALFIRAGGKPECSAPHYFVLGSSKWFEGLYPSTSKVVLLLSELRIQTTSITLPDSFTAMRLGDSYGVPLEPQKPYHDRIYLLSELAHLVNLYGIPTDEAQADYSNYVKEPFEKYIELQVWSDEPVRDFLSTA